jgi:hypothetical protein
LFESLDLALEGRYVSRVDVSLRQRYVPLGINSPAQIIERLQVPTNDHQGWQTIVMFRLPELMNDTMPVGPDEPVALLEPGAKSTDLTQALK